MLVLPMIPFFLGYVAEDKSNPSPSYIFQVRIDTLFVNKSGGHNEDSNAGLAFNLKCQPHKDQNLKCRIPKTISYSPSSDFVHNMNNKVFTPSSFQFSRIRYRMGFDFKGVKNYQILTDNVTNEEALLDMYEFIGDQLSVGANLITNDLEFNTTEDTISGKCPTFYKIYYDAMSSTNKFMLKSLIPSQKYKLKKGKSLHINKQRRVNECQPQKSYFFGKILWTDLITSNVTAKPKDSGSQMTIAQNEFYTKTIHTFDLYNEQSNKLVGFVYETINVKLVSIEP
ncbi:uncharacterized protein LOC116845115 [Odontomachus brunneus]|uniref:uncharacterized protein LOC116845115 n=1 Tax=Odontomachus brunneus TaxID=486640 RepID=UPI0013F1A221|nr:uncharacterized protein LOC116845115 [Odontomachus brunneus]XP_032673344.1 uncharacterized protein LOC116845115 [Odontomachus brunneus]